MSSAVLADMWDPSTLGAATAVFAVAPIAGPGVGPVVAGYLAEGGVSWRWLFWILTIFVSKIFYSRPSWPYYPIGWRLLGFDRLHHSRNLCVSILGHDCGSICLRDLIGQSSSPRGHESCENKQRMKTIMPQWRRKSFP